ncbi:MAG TPA: hypothetical protein VKV80_12550 [Streptosporangiaceae bacterium]|nr:hypothetical protein [Streptosporangiaceae bacterium]
MGLRELAAAVLAGVAVCVAAACDSLNPASGGGSSASAHPAPVTSAARAGSAGSSGVSTSECGNSPPAMVRKALGLPVGKLVASAEGPVTVCAYTGRYEVLVRYQTGETARQFAQDRRSMTKLHQSISSVGGLGNSAYFAKYTKSKPPSYTLAAREGDIAIFITSPAPLGAERALMARLLAKA